MTTVSQNKRVYAAPRSIDVGGLAELTKGHGEPVGDPPHDGTTGWYNAAGLEDKIELDD